VELVGTSFKFVKLKPEKFFGYTDQWFGDQRVSLAQKEKTIVDSLDQPRYVGEIAEVAKGLWNGRAELNFDRVLDYALRMGNNAILKRLGYLLDVLGLLQEELRAQMQHKLTYGYIDLDTSARRKAQELNRDWRVRVNVDPKNLIEWREH
jgi:predicted transcriptional regulator of viral defense system